MTPLFPPKSRWGVKLNGTWNGMYGMLINKVRFFYWRMRYMIWTLSIVQQWKNVSKFLTWPILSLLIRCLAISNWRMKILDKNTLHHWDMVKFWPLQTRKYISIWDEQQSTETDTDCTNESLLINNWYIFYSSRPAQI